MATNNLDLIPIFQAVTQALTANQQPLNQADEFNHDHGTNMMQTFQTITNALEQKQGKTAGVGLSYAAKQLAKTATSTSGQLYAQNLAQAASQLKGKKVDAQAALSLLQMLIGGSSASQPTGQTTSASVQGARASVGRTPQQTSSQGGDLLGALLGGLTSTEGSAASQPAQGGGDLLGTLLGGLTGTQPSQKSSQNGFGLDDLLSAGMAYAQAKQGGGSNMEALMQAFTAGSGMGNTTHREQSTQLVVNAFLQALTSMRGKQ